jgi:hypothetical protein
VRVAQHNPKTSCLWWVNGEQLFFTCLAFHLLPAQPIGRLQ